MLLITTSLNSKKITEPSVLLGEWCKTNSKYDSNKFKVCAYHWNDIQKQLNDYNVIKNIYNEYLEDISHTLNKMHKLQFSSHQWELIIGAWLRCFISICYDRYECLSYAFSNYTIKSVLNIKNKSPYKFSNSLEFFRDGIYTDEWNQNLIIQILKISKFYKDINIKNISSLEPQNKNNIKVSKIKKIIKKNVAKLNEKLIYKNKIVFHGMDIGIIENIKLNLGLFQFPCVLLPAEYNFKENNIRKYFILKEQTDPFKRILSQLIIQHSPSAYIENFNDIYSYVKKNYPQNAKAIVTATSYYKDEYFKVWVAQQKDKNAKYIIHQHGGNYGDTDYADEEELQLKTCDQYLSWGWTRDVSYWKNKTLRIPSLKLSILKHKTHNNFKYNPDGKIVLPLYEWPKFSYRLYSGPIASQQLQYNEQIITFCNALNKHDRNKLMFRMSPVERGWSLRKVLINQGFGAYIDQQSNSFIDDLKVSKLAVIHVKSTTLLEALSFNVPTICIFDIKFWKVNKQASYYYNLLSSANILFDNSLDAASWLNSNSEKLEEWWYDKKTQSVIKEFVTNYAYSEKQYIKTWIKEFKKYK